MVRLIVSLLLLAAFCLGAALSYLNWTPVPFDYLAGAAEVPLITLLLGAFLLGALVTGVLGLVRSWGQKLELRRLRRRLSDTEAELKNLRELPLHGGAPAETPGRGRNA